MNPKLGKRHKAKSMGKGFIQNKRKYLLIGGHCQIKRSLTKGYVLHSLLRVILSLSWQMHLTAIFYQPKPESGFLKILHSVLLTLPAEH